MAETGIRKAIKEAGGRQPLADYLKISYQAVAKFDRQGWMPLDRARATAEQYGIALRELVREDIRAAMDATAA